MRCLCIFWTTLLLFATFSVAGAAETDGFRGIGWGAGLATLNSGDFTRVPAFKGITPDTEVYQRKNDELKVAGAEVDGINYIFRKGRLVSVNVDFKGFSIYETFMAYCKERFGPATGSSAKNMELLTSFESPKTGALLYIQLGTPQYSFGRLYLYSREFFD